MAATLKLSPAAATEQLRAHGAAWWHAADAAELSAACAAVPDAALMQWPAVARWRALAALLTEHAEALPCLEQAHAGHLAAGDAAAALVDAHIALAFCLIDIGAMDRVTDWLQRSAAAASPVAAEPGLALCGRSSIRAAAMHCLA